MSIGIYAGSFDPFTMGHLDILNTAVKMFDKVFVAVGKNPGKNGLFSVEERIEYIKNIKFKYNLNTVSVDTFSNLLVEYCGLISQIENTNVVIVRGLRAISDFEQEMSIAHINSNIDNRFSTVFIPASPDKAFISSSAVKQLARFVTYENSNMLEKYIEPEIINELVSKVK